MSSQHTDSLPFVQPSDDDLWAQEIVPCLPDDSVVWGTRPSRSATSVEVPPISTPRSMPRLLFIGLRAHV